MINYDFKCTKCFYKFEELVANSDVKEIECPKCGAKSERQISVPRVSIPRKHQSAPKAYDSHPLDEGVPFGEVPGDEDYKWLTDKDDPRKFGPTP